MLKPHTPEFLSRVQIPVNYDPDAKCPAWDRFIDQTFGTELRDLAFEICGDAIVHDRSIPKAILLFGEGGNGKSTFQEGLRQFVGPENVATVSMQDLSGNRFAPAQLEGKLVNIFSDLPGRHLNDASVFKALTGGDEIRAERKYGQPFGFRPFARMIFSTNSLPYAKDASEAYFDRFVIVPFERRFRGADGEIPRSELDAMLADPKELSGLLNRALDGLDRLWERGAFTETDETRAALDEYRQTGDHLGIWLDQNLESALFPNAELPVREIRNAYNAQAIKEGRPPLSESQFGKRFRALRPKVDKARSSKLGGRPWVYRDVQLKS